MLQTTSGLQYRAKVPKASSNRLNVFFCFAWKEGIQKNRKNTIKILLKGVNLMEVFEKKLKDFILKPKIENQCHIRINQNCGHRFRCHIEENS